MTPNGKILIFATLSHSAYIYSIDTIKSAYDEMIKKKQSEDEDFETEDEDFVKIDPVKTIKVILFVMYCFRYLLLLMLLLWIAIIQVL